MLKPNYVKILSILELLGLDGIGLDDDDTGTPVGPEPRNPYPEDAVALLQSRTIAGSLEYSNLMAECQVLNSKR